MLNPHEIVHRWLCSPSVDMPAYVRAANRQIARHEEANSQRLVDFPMEDLEKFADLIDQKRLEFTHEDRHANVRMAVARYLDSVVLPGTVDPRLDTLPRRLREARQSGTILYHAEKQKFMTIWDAKAGLPLLCPDDAREEAMRVQRRVVPAVMDLLKQPGMRVYYGVFTMPNAAPGKLHQAQRQLFRRFNALMKKAKRDHKKGDNKFPFVGAYAVMESPLGWRRDWHPHLNVLLVTRGWFDFADLRKHWLWNVELKRVEGKEESLEAALRELIKYSVRTVPEKSQCSKPSTVRSSAELAMCSGSGMGTVEVIRTVAPQDSPQVEFPHSSMSLPEEFLIGSAPANDSMQFASGLPCATGQVTHADRTAPSMIEWTAPEFLEWWDAHKGFRRSRGYGALYRIDDPESESMDGYEAVGSVMRKDGQFVRRFSLLEFIPEDKSSTMTTRDRLRAYLKRLLGDPDAHRRALSLMQHALKVWPTLDKTTH